MPSKRKPARRIVMAVVYALYLFVFFEAAARLLLSVDPLFRRVSGRDDSSFRIEWVKQHGKRRDFEYKFYVYDLTRGWAVRARIKDMSVFGSKVLNSNSNGLRGKAEYEYPRTPGKRRIIVLGDSYTFGDEVSDDETYAHYLASLLPDTEVLNLGVSGYGHDQMLLYLKEEGVKYHPDIVILGYVSFDMYRNLRAFNSYAKPRFELLADGLHLTRLPVPPPDAILDQEPYRSKALDLLEILREKIRWKLGLNQKRAEKITPAILDELVATTRGMGAIPVFVYLPVLDEISNAEEAMTSKEQYLDRYCRDRGVPCLFLRRRFEEEIKTGVHFNTRSHWFANAHLSAAQGIKDYLGENGLLQQNRPERGWLAGQSAQTGGIRRVGSLH